MQQNLCVSHCKWLLSNRKAISFRAFSHSGSDAFSHAGGEMEECIMAGVSLAPASLPLGLTSQFIKGTE